MRRISVTANSNGNYSMTVTDRGLLILIRYDNATLDKKQQLNLKGMPVKV